jgi:hypothetical protein
MGQAYDQAAAAQAEVAVYRTRPFAVMVKPRAVTRMNGCLTQCLTLISCGGMDDRSKAIFAPEPEPEPKPANAHVVTIDQSFPISNN